MELINGTSPSVAGGPAGASGASDSFADLSSEDFLKLLIVELRQQDPLEPVGNEELLRQISSVREIELSTTLTESLRTLTARSALGGFGSASSLIGQYVTGLPGEDASVDSGIVVGVRFAEDGRPILLLSNGSELPLEHVRTIEPPIRAAEALMGVAVVGIDQKDPSNPEVVEGIVTGVRVDARGEVLLELDTGQELRFRDFVSVTDGE